MSVHIECDIYIKDLRAQLAAALKKRDEALALAFDAAYAERAAIVAWLRNNEINHGIIERLRTQYADVIERGDHLPATSAVKEPGT